MTAHKTVPAPSPRQESRSRSPLDRAKRLYADARLLEDLCPTDRGKEVARDVALLALDLLVEARGGVAA